MPRQPTSDSLELLLDTICNTFGGVVFIAVLVVLLVRHSGQQPLVQGEPVVPAEVVEELYQQLDSLGRELSDLHRTALQQEQVVAQLAPEDLQTIVDERNRLRAEGRNLLQTRDRTLSSIATGEVTIARIRDELDTLRDSLRNAEQELAAAEAELNAERAARTRSAGTPLVRSTNKTPVLTIVRYGRMYIWHRYGPGGNRQGLNTDDFVVLEERASGIVTTPKPTAGIILNDDAEMVPRIRTRLASFDPTTYYIDVAVRADSFGEFNYLRNAIVSLGFEYSLLPTSSDATLIDRGGADRGVQ
jgi:hypothetical protein